MKKVLGTALALVGLAAFSNAALAQQKSPPASAEAKQPAAAAKNSGAVTDSMMTGKVLRVDAKAKTFTVMSKGKDVTFSAAEMKAPLPKVGEILDIKYTQTPGGVMKSIALNASRAGVY